jgi:hypothetical protein
MRRSRPLLRTVLKLAPVLVLSIGLSVVGLVAFRAVVPMASLAPAADAVGNYLQTVGGIYAVLLAFVVYVVWGQYNDARGLVDRESTALVDLHRTASGLSPAARAEIQDGLEHYLDAVLAEEWQAMAARDEATIERVGAFLDHVWLAIHKTRPRGDCQHAIYGEILTRFNNLTDIRTNRLSAARARVPTAMRILLYTGAVLTIGSMYLMAIDALWLHITVTAALAGAIGHILFLIVDLDDAFAEDRVADREPFVRARKAFARDAHLVDAAED